MDDLEEALEGGLGEIIAEDGLLAEGIDIEEQFAPLVVVPAPEAAPELTLLCDVTDELLPAWLYECLFGLGDPVGFAGPRCG